MRGLTVLLGLALFLVSVCTAWTSEDHEIFRLRDEVLQAEGPDVTFYDILGITSNAAQSDINAALRKKSKRLHPDKAIPSMLAARSAPKPTSKSGTKKPGVHVKKGPSQKERAAVTKEANERYARLRVITSVLQGPSRERYDHFLKNGFPVWKGTGFYYARFRPGLGSVIVGLLVVFGGGAHYGAMYLSWKRQRDFVQRYVSHAKHTAYGPNGIPGVPGLDNINNTAALPPPAQEEDFAGPLNRRQKRLQEKESKKKDTGRAAKSIARGGTISAPIDAEPMFGPQGSRKKVVAENGKILIVDSVGDVYLEEKTEDGQLQEFLLDPEEIPKPTITQTALFRLPIWIFNQTLGRVVDKVRGNRQMQDAGFLDEDGENLTTQISPDAEDALQTATSPNPNAEAKRRKAKSKASAGIS